MKRYQFVIQFPGDSVVDYDAMVEIEGDLEKLLENSSEKISGHDMGCNQRNIFIWTTGPKITLRTCLDYLQNRGIEKVIMGYRNFDNEENFHVLWPTGKNTVLKIL